MFITLTCPATAVSGAGGTTADPSAYDYGQAPRDPLHFAALFGRLVRNLRRLLGHDLQYFAAIEPQRRPVPHVHIAIRGTLSRTELRQVLAATCHQVWWPPASAAQHDEHLPVCHEATGSYVNPERPGSSCRPGTPRSTPSATETNRRTWPGSRHGSMRRASSRVTRRGPVHRLPGQISD
jgi:hypothetical protein